MPWRRNWALGRETQQPMRFVCRLALGILRIWLRSRVHERYPALKPYSGALGRFWKMLLDWIQPCGVGALGCRWAKLLSPLRRAYYTAQAPVTGTSALEGKICGRILPRSRDVTCITGTQGNKTDRFSGSLLYWHDISMVSV